VQDQEDCEVNIFMGFRSTGGQNVHFPTDFAGRLVVTTVL